MIPERIVYVELPRFRMWCLVMNRFAGDSRRRHPFSTSTLELTAMRTHLYHVSNTNGWMEIGRTLLFVCHDLTARWFAGPSSFGYGSAGACCGNCRRVGLGGGEIASLVTTVGNYRPDEHILSVRPSHGFSETSESLPCSGYLQGCLIRWPVIFCSSV